MSSPPPIRDQPPPPAPAAGPIEARLPLALLEAVRAIDTPEHDWDTELVEELRTKRLGLSHTVQQQIRRYGDAVRVRQRIPGEEVAQLARLIGRRPDAEQAFREAGRRWAHGVVEHASTLRRRAARQLPGWLARPVALALLRTIASRSFGGRLVRQGSTLHFVLDAPVAVEPGATPSPCQVYEAAFREALREVTGMDSAVDHMQCRARGNASCEWRADWRRR